MSLTTVCLLAFAALAAGNLLSRIFREGLEAREVLERVPPARIGDGRTGWIRVTGRVRPLTKPLRAPWSETTAVYFELRVHAHGEDLEPLKQSQRHVQAVTFEIDDGTGRALVRLPPAETENGGDRRPEILTALAATKKARFWGFRGLPREIVRLLWEPELGFGTPWTPVTIVERVIRPGDEITVAGRATLQVNPAGVSANSRSPPMLLVFEATPEHALVLGNAGGLASWWGV